MPEFQYAGVNKQGQKVDGKIEAPNEGEARMVLRSRGIRPTKLGKVSLLQADLGSMLGGGGRVKLELIVAFTRQLHTLISSGVPIVQSLESLSEQTPDKTLKNVLAAITEKVAQGSFLWESMAAYPKIFPRIYISLVRAGESSGAMDTMLKRLSRYLEDNERMRRTLKSAMFYPASVFVISLGVIALMLTMVIPKFEKMLVSSGQELPGPTAFVINLSHFLVDNAIPVFGGIGLFIFVVLRYVKTDDGRAQLHHVLFKLPLFGTLIQKGGVARFSRTLSTLLSSGVTLVDAIDICKATVDNAVLEDAISKIRPQVETGNSLGGVVGKMPVFPKMAVQMIAVGESTGNLDSMLDKLADFYEEEVEALVQGLTKLIEPFILVFLGGVVGGLLISMYLPIFKMAGGG